MSFELAEDFGINVQQIYRDYGYTIIDVPRISAEERTQFIIDRLAAEKMT